MTEPKFIMKWLRLFNDNIREIEYFSESGKGMPNGSHIQRGGFLTECYRNANKFVTVPREKLNLGLKE